jgi:hypothetical protein
VANRNGHSLTVLLNRGALSFASRELRLDRSATDVAAADANRDGITDLIIAARSGGEGTHGFEDGVAYVLIGAGDGSFAPPTPYSVARGAHRIVVADLTGDGVLDLATANWSAAYADDCGPAFKGFDSVSIVPGLGDGSFGQATSFALGAQDDVEDDTFRNSVRSLATRDVNGDQRPDLVASNRSILLSSAPTPNRAPVVDAGPDTTRLNDRDVYLRPSASDADGHLLTYRWTVTGGVKIPGVANPCLAGLEDGEHTFTVTVDDGLGGTATDSVTYRIVTQTSSNAPGILDTTRKAGARRP